MANTKQPKVYRNAGARARPRRKRCLEPIQ